MKKRRTEGLIWGLVFLALMSTGVSADTFDVLKGAYFTLCTADYVTTLAAMQQNGAIELNPIAKQYVNQPEIFTPITFGLMVVQDWGFTRLRKWNKTAAFIFLGVLTAVKMYAVFNNVRILTQQY